MLNKEKVKELYLKGYTAVEIAKRGHGEYEAIKKCIQRNFSHLKSNHEIAIVQRKDAVRATNYEANKYISDKSFVLKNRSIYKTLPSGDIVLNKDVAGAVSWDTPRRLVNEFKSCT